jgi:5'-nucleotidase
MTKPLLLISNDDGVESPGLRALVRSLRDLGDILVAAPLEQQSGAGASRPPHTSCRIFERSKIVDGEAMTFYAIDGTPVQAVQHGMAELIPRRPDLVVAGINYGVNIGASIVSSGTVGAALEGAMWGIPAIAVSLQTVEEYSYSDDDGVDFSTAGAVARQFALQILTSGMPADVDVLKIDVPHGATLETPWRMTRVSRYKKYKAIPPQRVNLSDPGRIKRGATDAPFEPDSDVIAVLTDHVISVAPLRANLSALVDLSALQSQVDQHRNQQGTPT